MWLAGDDAAAKAVVDGLVRDIRFAPLDTGLLRDSSRQQPGGPLFAGVTLAEARELVGSSA